MITWSSIIILISTIFLCRFKQKTHKNINKTLPVRWNTGLGRRYAYTTVLFMGWVCAEGLDGTTGACLGTMMGIWQRQQITRCQSFAGRRPRCRRGGRSAVCCCYKSHNWWQRPTLRRIKYGTGSHTVTAEQQNPAHGPQALLTAFWDCSNSMDI